MSYRVGNASTANSQSVYGMNDGCNYSRLGGYRYGGIRAPVPTSTVTGYYVVPNYSAPGYSALTHGPTGGCGDSSNGYFQIGKAYGYGANNCSTTYSASLCG